MSLISELYTAETLRRELREKTIIEEGGEMINCMNGHDEILFYGGECPVCSRDAEIYELDQAIAEYHLKLEFFKMEVAKFDKKLAELKVWIAAYGKPYKDTTEGMNEFKKEG